MSLQTDCIGASWKDADGYSSALVGAFQADNKPSRGPTDVTFSTLLGKCDFGEAQTCSWTYDAF